MHRTLVVMISKIRAGQPTGWLEVLDLCESEMPEWAADLNCSRHTFPSEEKQSPEPENKIYFTNLLLIKTMYCWLDNNSSIKNKMLKKEI